MITSIKKTAVILSAIRSFHLPLILLLLIVLNGCLASEIESGGPKGLNVQGLNSGSHRLYHGVFPGGVNMKEDRITQLDLTAYEKAVGKKTAWVYFSHNWYDGHSFPEKSAKWIRDRGSIPFIRLQIWSSSEIRNREDPKYAVDKIISGVFDNDFRAWAQNAAKFGSPLMVEYGVEINGRWFPWNGHWNGGDETAKYGDPDYPDGPERFRDAYRRIIDIMRDEAADNITWVFHVSHADYPEENWNRMEYYYPGNDYIDVLGVSIYGPTNPGEDEAYEFRQMMDYVYPRLSRMNKPILVLEFGCTHNHPRINQAGWAERALFDLTNGRWSKVVGISWWNEAWQRDSNPTNDTNMRVQDNSDLSTVFQRMIGANPNIVSNLNDPINF
jgi:hypothetical protein